MPRHGNQKRIPVDVEPQVFDALVEQANKLKLTRTRLARIFIKFGLENLEAALQHGDTIITPTHYLSEVSTDAKEETTSNN